MAMSIAFLRPPVCAAALLCLPTSALAEFGIGTAQDPVTWQYTHGVQKDWQEGIVLDPQTGNHIVTYKDAYDSFNSLIFEPATKIFPTVKSRFRRSNVGNTVLYDYEVKNYRKSKQNIYSLLARVSSINGVHSPSNWNGSAAPSIVDPTVRLGWVYRIEKMGDGLSPGRTERGFSVESNHLPGMGTFEVSGSSKSTVWLGNTPPYDTEVGKQLRELERSDFVPRLAAVPRVPVPTPWDTATVLANIRTHLNTDMVSMQLIDPVFANELNRLFTAAIEAAKHNNDKGVKENLKDIRKALKKAHKDVDDDKKDNEDSDWESTDPKQKPKPATVDRLAARALDFDVKYVLRRLGKDKED